MHFLHIIQVFHIFLKNIKISLFLCEKIQNKFYKGEKNVFSDFYLYIIQFYLINYLILTLFYENCLVICYFFDKIPYEMGIKMHKKWSKKFFDISHPGVLYPCKIVYSFLKTFRIGSKKIFARFAREKIDFFIYKNKGQNRK